ncbi:MAG: Snf7 family protein [Candidatus Bathyarchaeia archaeon]
MKRLGRRLRPIPFRERIANTLYKLSVQRDRLDQMAAKLQQRDQEMFQRCIGAQISKDFARATMYANECAEIRKMAKVVLSSQLALERVMLRLQTVEEFGDIYLQIAPIMEVVKETRGRISGVIPEVARELDEINKMLYDMTLEVGEAHSREITLGPSSEEAKKVLEESSAIAEQRIEERFPDPSRAPLGLREAEAIGGGPAEPDSALESKILEYIRSQGGALNLSPRRCALELNASVEEVNKALENLVKKGKVILGD